MIFLRLLQHLIQLEYYYVKLNLKLNPPKHTSQEKKSQYLLIVTT